MKYEFDNYKGTTSIIVGALVISFLLFAYCEKGVENPRHKNGIHYIKSKDSIYKLKI